MKTSKKSFGFYATLFSCVLAIAGAICYGVTFPSIEYKEQVFDLRICIILAAAGVIAAVLLLAGKQTAGFAPVVLCLGSGISMMLFVQIAIWPVSDTIYGIEPFPPIHQPRTRAAPIRAPCAVADIGRAEYRAIDDGPAVEAFALLSMTEGIMPAIESAHALAGALALGRELGEDAVILVSLSGRGDKDVDTASRWFGLVGDEPARADLAALRDAARRISPDQAQEPR